MITRGVYRSIPSVTTETFLLLSEIWCVYDTFRPTWPSSGNTQYGRKTWGEIISNEYYNFLQSKSNYKVYVYIVKHNSILGGMLFTIRRAQLHVSGLKYWPSSGCTMQTYQSDIHAFIGGV